MKSFRKAVIALLLGAIISVFTFSSLAAKCNHTFKDIVTPPTCTKAGRVNVTCTKCGYVLYSGTAASARGHSYVSTVTKQPTCTATGQKRLVCSRCGNVKFENISATGHSMISRLVEPTCTLGGYTLNSCQNRGCSYSYKSNNTKPKGHNTYTVNTATCTSSGAILNKCRNCDYSQYLTSSSQLPHSFVTMGGDTQKCSSCGLYCYYIRYSLNGGTGSINSQYKLHNQTAYLTSVIPTLADSTFLGWARSNTAVSPDYQAGAAYSANAPLQLYAVWKKNESQPTSQGGWVYMFREPNMCTKISEGFPSYSTGDKHYGVDIIGDTFGDVYNTPVYGITDGKVFEQKLDVEYGRGQFVEIITNDGYNVLYLHLIEGSSTLSKNDVITTSSFIGRAGRSGACYPKPHNNNYCKTYSADSCQNSWYCDFCGAHLHFEVREASGTPVQPLNFFPSISFTY